MISTTCRPDMTAVGTPPPGTSVAPEGQRCGEINHLHTRFHVRKVLVEGALAVQTTTSASSIVPSVRRAPVARLPETSTSSTVVLTMARPPSVRKRSISECRRATFRALCGALLSDTKPHRRRAVEREAAPVTMMRGGGTCVPEMRLLL